MNGPFWTQRTKGHNASLVGDEKRCGAAIEIVVPDEFWCSICDANKVKGLDRNTGRFYIQSGHIWKGRGITDTYESVVFAICKRCIKLLKKGKQP